MILCPEPMLVAIEFLFGQHKYPVTADFKLKPDECDLGKALLEGLLTISNLNDENTVISEKTGCIMQYR